MDFPLDQEGLNYKPWEKRTRIIPQRTYSGTVIYKRPKHYFSPKDLQRIQKNVQQNIWDIRDQNILESLLETCFALWNQALEVLSYVDPFGITKTLQDWAQRMIFSLITKDNESWKESRVIELIYSLAGKAPKLDITIKRRP